jgi:hypothetical protein
VTGPVFGVSGLVPPSGIDSASWSGDGKSVYILTNMGVHSEVQQLDLASGRASPLEKFPRLEAIKLTAGN